MKRGQKNIFLCSEACPNRLANFLTFPSKATAAITGNLLGCPGTNMWKALHVQKPECAHALIHYQARHRERDRKSALVSRWSPLKPPPLLFSWKWRTGSTHSRRLTQCSSLPAGQHPSNSHLLLNKPNQGEGTEGIRCFPPLEASLGCSQRGG